MDEETLLAHIFASDIFRRWHWFRWHFEHLLRGARHPMAQAIVDTCVEIDQLIPGFALGMIDELAAISGKEKFEPHWEQLLQRLAEIHIIRQAVQFTWPFTPTFAWEPVSSSSKKNPELTVSGDAHAIGFEVKAPSLLSHIRLRGDNPTQVPSRSLPREMVDSLPDADQGITLPRDNPVKDFLISADEKFSGFKADDPMFRGVLVIVWDDFVYEPISSLLHPGSGLFTSESFARDSSDAPLLFPNVDSVIVIRYLHQIMRATRDEPFIDQCEYLFDYGSFDTFPPKVYIANPNGQSVPDHVYECFQSTPTSPMLGAEYNPSDLIWWLKM